jgi:hypothetical protein
MLLTVSSRDSRKYGQVGLRERMSVMWAEKY